MVGSWSVVFDHAIPVQLASLQKQQEEPTRLCSPRRDLVVRSVAATSCQLVGLFHVGCLLLRNHVLGEHDNISNCVTLLSPALLC